MRNDCRSAVYWQIDGTVQHKIIHVCILMHCRIKAQATLQKPQVVAGLLTQKDLLENSPKKARTLIG